MIPPEQLETIRGKSNIFVHPALYDFLLSKDVKDKIAWGRRSGFRAEERGWFKKAAPINPAFDHIELLMSQVDAYLRKEFPMAGEHQLINHFILPAWREGAPGRHVFVSDEQVKELKKRSKLELSSDPKANTGVQAYIDKFVFPSIEARAKIVPLDVFAARAYEPLPEEPAPPKMDAILDEKDLKIALNSMEPHHRDMLKEIVPEGRIETIELLRLMDNSNLRITPTARMVQDKGDTFGVLLAINGRPVPPEHYIPIANALCAVLKTKIHELKKAEEEKRSQGY